MSLYAIHKMLYLLRNDAAFEERIVDDAAAVLDEIGLDDEERSALEAGDVRALYEMGVHVYLLGGLSRRGLFGITRENYIRRMKQEEQPPRLA